MNHFPLNLPPSDSLFYSPMDHHHNPHHHHHHHHHPFFYSNFHHHTQNDDDSDNSSSNNLNSTTNNNNTNNNNNNDNRSETTSSQNSHSQAMDHHHHREHMFEKPLTPSDVGKLNRLVIPKQHAEKYFPLAGVSSSSTPTSTTVDGGGGGSSGGGGGGVLLGFEDESGKCWRFRYSYWNSSQSYVLTKGWSRYVKEKKLDAGDVVLFERHRFEPDRFFIGWRRRRGSVPVQPPVRPVEDFAHGSGWGQGQRYNNHNNNAAPMQVHHHQAYALPHRINSFPYHHHHQQQQHQQTDCFHAAGVRQQSQKAGGRSGGSKKLRLFGVNLECQLEEGTTADDIDTEPQTSDGSSLSSQGPVHGSGFGPGFGSGSGSGVGPTPYIYVGYPLNHHDHMDMNFPQDVNQMRNRLG